MQSFCRGSVLHMNVRTEGQMYQHASEVNEVDVGQAVLL
jgi:hypothetical protein